MLSGKESPERLQGVIEKLTLATGSQEVELTFLSQKEKFPCTLQKSFFFYLDCKGGKRCLMFNTTFCLKFYKSQLGFPSIEVSFCFRGEILFEKRAYIFFCFKHNFYLCKYLYLAITYVRDTQRKVYSNV